MPRVPQSRERYLRSPRLVARPDGGATLHLIAWEPEGERIARYELDSEGVPSAPSLGPIAAAIVALAPGDPARCVAEEADLAVARDDRVEVRREGYLSRVVLSRGSGEEILVWEAYATAAAPALAAGPDGLWVAFHHNLREDEERPDLAKWIALRFVDDEGVVHAPSAPMTGRDRDLEGEEQSFEFPELAVGDDGAVALFGRGSHRFYRQDLGAEGFGPRAPLGDAGWGCRGRRISVVTLADGALLTARRDEPGIELERMAPPRGGRPALSAVGVARLGTPPPVEARDPALDPARAWGLETLFGDIHQHSAHSDGLGTADEPYLRARHLYGDDFCALSDHESFLGKRVGPGEWAHLQRVAERHDEPGEFATLLAYEWTGRMHPGPGHKVVYLPRPGAPIVSRDDVPDGSALVRAVASLGGFSVPHHVGWTGADEGAHEPALQPVWEICSCHGCYESFGHALGQRGDLRDQMVDAVLRRGHRFGFIASSDGHGLLFHHGVARKRDPFRTGLAAVQARARTREAILEALVARRCYATSGAKILLDVRAGDAPMGSELHARAEVEAVARGTTDIVRLELVDLDGVVASAPGRGPAARVCARARAGLLYARVTQSDGEMAWSSPIFFDR